MSSLTLKQNVRFNMETIFAENVIVFDPKGTKKYDDGFQIKLLSCNPKRTSWEVKLYIVKPMYSLFQKAEPLNQNCNKNLGLQSGAEALEISFEIHLKIDGKGNRVLTLRQLTISTATIQSVILITYDGNRLNGGGSDFGAFPDRNLFKRLADLKDRELECSDYQDSKNEHQNFKKQHKYQQIHGYCANTMKCLHDIYDISCSSLYLKEYRTSLLAPIIILANAIIARATILNNIPSFYKDRSIVEVKPFINRDLNTEYSYATSPLRDIYSCFIINQLYHYIKQGNLLYSEDTLLYYDGIIKKDF